MPSAALLNTSGRSLAAAATSRRRHASSGTIQRPARMQPAAAFGADSAATNGSNGSNGAAPRRRLATLLLHSEGLVNDEFGASMPPIYQTATFTQPGATDMGEYDYSRSGNPTRTVLERQLAVLEVRGCCWGGGERLRWSGPVLRPAVVPARASELCWWAVYSRFCREEVLQGSSLHLAAPRRCGCCTELPAGKYRLHAERPPTLPAAPLPLPCQGAERAFAFSSGMSALAAVTRLLKAGDHVVAGEVH